MTSELSSPATNFMYQNINASFPRIDRVGIESAMSDAAPSPISALTVGIYAQVMRVQSNLMCSVRVHGYTLLAELVAPETSLIS